MTKTTEATKSCINCSYRGTVDVKIVQSDTLGRLAHFDCPECQHEQETGVPIGYGGQQIEM